MTKQQYEQATQLQSEATAVNDCANRLREYIAEATDYYPDLPTAGLKDNLLDQINKWETEQTSQIKSQFDEI